MSQDIVSSLQSVSYTSKDFNSIYPELLDTVKKLSYKWDPSISNESDPGVILLKLNAIIADKCNYNIDTNVLECFPLSVTQQRNARQLFEQLGYYMKWKQSATTNVTLKWIGDTSIETPYTIPPFSMVTDSDTSVVYTLIGPSEVGEDEFVVASQKLYTDGVPVVFKAIEGVVADFNMNSEYKITADMLDSNNRLYFSETDIAENGIFIHNYGQDNYSSWKKRDNLLLETLSSDNKFYKFGISLDTNACYLEFPENAVDLFGNGINIKYIKTTADAGNIAVQILEKFYVNVVPEEDTSVTLSSTNVKISNYIQGAGGADYESISEAYDNYKRTVGTFNTLITLRDYLNKILTSKLVSNGFVCDRTNDIQLTYPITSVDSAGNSISHTQVEREVVGENPVEGFKLTTSKPDDWDSHYTDYYTRSYNSSTHALTYSPVTGASAPTWAANTYYEIITENNPALTAFDIKLYLLQYQKSVTSASEFYSTFNMLTPTETAPIELYIEDIKAISHDFADIIGKTDDNSHFCYFINTYPLNINIITQYELTSTQKSELISNIKQALYNNLNSNELDFGDSVSSSYILTSVLNSDGRIKSATIGKMKYTTTAVYYDETENAFKSVYVNELGSDWYSVEETQTGTATSNPATYITIDETGFMPLVNYKYGKHRLTRQTEVIGSYTGEASKPADWTYNFDSYFEKKTASGSTYYDHVKSTNVWADNTYYKYINGKFKLITGTNAPEDWNSREAVYYQKNSNGSFSPIARTAPDPTTWPTGKYFKKWDNTQGHVGIKETYTLDSSSGIETMSGVSGLDLIKSYGGYGINIYINEPLQFRDEIYTKSVLAGVTQFFVKDESFDYTLGQSMNSTTQCISTVRTNSFFKVGSGVDGTETLSNNCELKANESVQMFSPSLISKYEYSNSVKIEWKLTADIPANSNYLLGENEQVAFYWKDNNDSSSVYSYFIHGKGSIICPTFNMSRSSLNTDAEVLNDLWQNNSKFGEGTPESPWYISSALNGAMNSRNSNIVSGLTSSDSILSGTKTVSVKVKNTVTLNNTNCCYWILNETTNDGNYYELFPEGTSAARERILQSNEYFIYSNSALSEMVILGAGTRLILTGSSSQWIVPVMDYAEIVEYGEEALSKYWHSIEGNTTITAEENTYVIIGSGNQMKFETNSFTFTTDTVTTEDWQGSPTITIDSGIYRSKMGSNYGFNLVTTFTCEISGSGASAVTKWKLNNNEVTLGDYGLSIQQGATLYNNCKIKVTTSTSWKIEINSNITKVYRWTGSWQEVTEGIRYFNIYYKIVGNDTWTQVPSVDIEGRSWTINSALSLNTSSSTYQILYPGQTVEIVTGMSSGEPVTTTITGASLSNGRYPVVLMTDQELSVSGGNTSYSAAGISFYNFQMSEDTNTGYNNENHILYKSDGTAKIQFPASNATKNGNIFFNIPSGNYILPFRIIADENTGRSLSAELYFMNPGANYAITTSGSGSVSFIPDTGKTTFESFMGFTGKKADNITLTYDNTTSKFTCSEYNKSGTAAQFGLTSGQTTLQTGDTVTIKMYPDNRITRLHSMSSDTLNEFKYGNYYFIELDIGDMTVGATKDLLLKTKLTGNNARACSVAFGNIYRYNYPENAAELVSGIAGDTDTDTKKYFANKIKNLIKKFDVDNKFNYVYEVPSDMAIPDPMSADSFLRPNHVFNKYTICRYNTSIYDSNGEQYIKILE